MAAVVALLPLWAAAARAQTLVTGSIRDTRGIAVAGARVWALDAAGHLVGSDLASDDGTFAVSSAAEPSTLLIACDYCNPARRAVVVGEPVVVIIDRFAALAADSPTSDDLRALPYRQSSDLASLVPFSNISAGRIADRDLDRFGAIVVAGLPFVDERDGSSVDGLLPAHAVAALGVASPLSAPIVGGYASGGVYAFDLSDPDLPTSRLDAGNAADLVVRADGSRIAGGYAASSDDGEHRQAADANARFGLGPGQLSIDALDLADTTTHASGFGLAYWGDVAGYGTGASLSATDISGSSLVALGAHVAAHDPFNLELGIRATRATARDDMSAEAQSDAALYLAASRRTSVNAFATSLAWDTGSDSGTPGGSRATALIGSIADDARLGPRWAIHAGSVSDLRIPTFAELSVDPTATLPGDRRLLFEGWLSYTDLRRLRIRALTYTARTTGPAAQSIHGAGIDAAWQIAPSLALRTWILAARQATPPLATALAAESDGTSAAAQAVTGKLFWLSYERGFRVDALVRGGALEGDVRLPLDRSYALSVGTSRSAGRRHTTLGLTRR